MHKPPSPRQNHIEVKDRKREEKSTRERRVKQPGTRRVTVCLAALAAKGDCIVCIADKALSYADVTWDSDAEKIIPLGPRLQERAVALTAGADRYISRFIRKISDFDGFSSKEKTIAFLECQFLKCLEETQDIEILLPAALSRQEYKSIVSQGVSSETIIEIHKRMDFMAQKYDMDIIICGFDSGVLPYILHITPPGLVIDYSVNGLYAIGAGAERAMSRMLFSGHTRQDGVSHTLYDCFDAKASAEMSTSVGVDWDAYLISGPFVKPVVPEAKPLLDRVWKDRNESPFRTKPRAKDELPRAPKDWRLKLKQMVAASLGSSFDESKDTTAF